MLQNYGKEPAYSFIFRFAGETFASSRMSAGASFHSVAALYENDVKVNLFEATGTRT